MTPTIEDFASKMDLIVHSPTGPMISDQPFTTSGKTIFQYFYDRRAGRKTEEEAKKDKYNIAKRKVLLPIVLKKDSLSYFVSGVFGLLASLL